MPRGFGKKKPESSITKMEREAKTAKPKSSAEKNKEALAFVESLRKSGLVGDIEKKIDFIPTGSWVVNRLIGDGTLKDRPGGIPRGYMTEIYGDEATGKTTLGLCIAKQALELGGRVIYADFEQSLRTQQQYIKNMGIDISPPNFLHIIPSSLEEGAKAIGQSLVKLSPWVIIIDSVTAMYPKANMEKDAEETTQIGLQAKLVGNFLQWMNKRLPKYNCALILINQMRANIKSSQYDEGPKEITSGGKAVRFFTTIRLHLKGTGDRDVVEQTSAITGLSEKKAVSQSVKVVVEKNKLDMPWKSGPIYIEFGQGVDNIMSLVSLGINKNIIKKSGPAYTWQDPNSEKSMKVTGKLAVKKFLQGNPDVLEAMKPYLLPTTDTKEMDEIQDMLEGKGVENLSADEKEQLKSIRQLKGQSTEDLEFTADELKDLEELKGITGEK